MGDYVCFLWSFVFFILSFLSFFFGLGFLVDDYSLILDWDIIGFNSCSLVMTLLFDWVSLVFMGGVMFISSMVIFYSSSYMSGDGSNVRFLYLVVLFVFSMCLMVVSPNLISILLGWDGLGLVSYCLVIYFQNFKSYSSGMLTILSNRIGDVAILLGIGLMASSGGWYLVFYSFYFYEGGYLLMLMIVLASFTSSAQIPFSSWLPAAMAAPTPVSALVHSSTLVTAGVYLMIRFSNVFEFFDVSFFLLMSVLTMFMSGLGAIFEFDMKSIIALSTLSQLGLMMSILFMGFPIVAFFHLMTHAFFKALLFLCAGLIIHCVGDVQDIRYMGGLAINIPFTSSCFCISNFSLCGLPFLSGFYSKDLIVEVSSMSYFSLLIYLIFYISVGLTACYSMRLVYYLMVNYLGLGCCMNYSEDFYMTISMVFLVFMSVLGGCLLGWLIFSSFCVVVLPFLSKFLAIFLVMLGGLFGYWVSGFNSLFCSGWLKGAYFYLGSMWFMPFFSTWGVYSWGLGISLGYMTSLDYGWGEYLVSRSLSRGFVLGSSLFLIYQNNNVSIFLFIFLLITLFMFIL